MGLFLGRGSFSERGMVSPTRYDRRRRQRRIRVCYRLRAQRCNRAPFRRSAAFSGSNVCGIADIQPAGGSKAPYHLLHHPRDGARVLGAKAACIDGAGDCTQHSLPAIRTAAGRAIVMLGLSLDALAAQRILLLEVDRTLAEHSMNPIPHSSKAERPA